MAIGSADDPKSPEECFAQSVFGFGPFSDGVTVLTCPSHAPGQGYGGSVYGNDALGDPIFLSPETVFSSNGAYGAGPYGLGSFGSTSAPRVPVPVSGGYGGSPYGLGPYGSTDGALAQTGITSVNQIDGCTLEIFFSSPIKTNTAFFDVSSYIFVVLSHGAPVIVSGASVGLASGSGAATSIILSHSCTTLGGAYQLNVSGLEDLSGLTIIEDAVFLALGDPPTYSIEVINGGSLVATFSEPMLDSLGFPGISGGGIEDVSAYGITSGYPITQDVLGASFPHEGDTTKVLLQTQGMTSVPYDLTITPAVAIRYAGDILPNESTDILGSELGTGSSILTQNVLTINKLSGQQYGWNFEDISGRFVAGSSVRMDVTLDIPLATIEPQVEILESDDSNVGDLVGVYFSDGSVDQIGIILFTEKRSILSVDTLVHRIRLSSGSLSEEIDFDWRVSPLVVSMIRNQKADSYAMLLNGIPFITKSTSAPDGPVTIPPGVQVLLSSTFSVSGFLLREVAVSATQTVFSAAWNFLHDDIQSFDGVAEEGFVLSSFLTKSGPLTKGWGDGRAATHNDVQVYINGVEVDVASVNPYIGKVTTAIPIPLTAPGLNSIEVDYNWIPNPTMAMAGLNVEGCVLNMSGDSTGRDTTSPENYVGGSDSSRFTFGLVLNGVESPSPKRVAHRFIGQEKAYTSSLNSPTSLLLNQNPHSISVEKFKETPEPVVESYEAFTEPLLVDPPWGLVGVDSGSHEVGTEVYSLIDASAGSFGVGEPAYYYRDVNLEFPTIVNMAARFSVDDFTLDGVFTGVGLGIHNNRKFYLAGTLVVNGVLHVGMLLDPKKPHLLKSWQVGPTFGIEILSSTSFRMDSSGVPVSLEEGDRFQILSGSQSGVYTVSGFTNKSDGTTSFDLSKSSPFPADHTLWTNDVANATFETRWDKISTYRMLVDVNAGKVQLFVTGEISSVAVDINRIPDVGMAADSTLLFSTEGSGQVFWGSLSRRATSRSTWSFFRYGIAPTETTFYSLGEIVSSEMESLPEDDPNSEWALTQGFGYAEVVDNDFEVRLKSNIADSSLDMTFGYQRVEPFLLPENHLSVDFGIQVEDGTAGWGDAQVLVRDTNKEILLATLRYLEPDLFSGSHRLIDLPYISMGGFRSPEEQGWELSGVNPISFDWSHRLLTLTQVMFEDGKFSNNVDLSGIDFDDTGDRIIEARLSVDEFTANVGGETGVFFSAEAGTGANLFNVGLTFLHTGSVAQVAMISSGAIVRAFDFNWNDGEVHTYRLKVGVSSASVALFIDAIPVSPVEDLALFQATEGNTRASFGAYTQNTESISSWEAFSVVTGSPAGEKRTLGFWTGGNKDELNSWAIPRDDGGTMANSSPSASIIEMDWSEKIEGRIAVDPGWGASLLRPDLPLPPWWDGEFATDSMEPSAGWLNVEYPRFPTQGSLFGLVSFGALNRVSITQQKWDYLRYRIFSETDNDFRSPHTHVLNRVNIVNSEWTSDRTPEKIVLHSDDLRTINMVHSDFYAQAIFKVLDNATSVIISIDQIEFDSDTQIIRLGADLSSENAEVTVVFSPSATVTESYIDAQPFEDSSTILNEGTPTFEMSQTGEAVRQIAFGSKLNDPSGHLNEPDFILNDSFRSIEFVNEDDQAYECMRFTQLEDGGDEGLLSAFCDLNEAGISGLQEIEFEGLIFNEYFGGGSDVCGDAGTKYDGTNIFHYGGGLTFSSGAFSPHDNPYVFWSGYSPGGNVAGSGLGGICNQIQIHLDLESVVVGGVSQNLEDDFSLNPLLDNIPPGYSLDPSIVPNGTPGTGNGAVLAVIETPGDYSRYGPWGGISTLEPRSLFYGASSAQPTGVPASGAGLVFLGGVPKPSGTIQVINIVSS